MKKLNIGFFAIVLVLCLSFQSWAQNTNDPVKVKKEENQPYLFWGGSLWFGFGTYTYADVNAIFGIQLHKRINIGLTGKYQYYKEKDILSSGDFQTFENHVYGGSVFSQIAIIEDFRNLFKVKGHSGIIAHVEYEFLNTDYNFVHFNAVSSDRSRYWLYNTLVGGGYVQHLGKKAKSYMVLLWNVTQSNDNPYTYPQFRIGFSITI